VKPLLFLTGFLGAGKTTLLRSLVTAHRRVGLAADVILNDFANADLDAATLPAGAASIAPIAASCACCESFDELVAFCLKARDSSGDALLVELNGTADPLPLLEAFTLLEEKLPFFPRWQAGVVDARYWGRRGPWDSLERRQLETATHWILTHAESLTAREIRSLAEQVAAVNPRAVRVNAASFAEEWTALTLRCGTEPEPLQTVNPGGGSGHAHRHDEVHGLSHRFTGVLVPLPDSPLPRAALHCLLESLPAEVVRAKALVRLADAPGSRWLFERTGSSPLVDPLEVPDLRRVASSLVCIGPDLDPSALRALVAEHFGVAANAAVKGEK